MKRPAARKATAAVPTRYGRDWWEKEGRKLPSATLCPKCEAVYYDGHWHTAPKLAARLKAAPKGVKAHETLCHECHHAAHGPRPPRFEGEVTLDGLVDASEKSDILACVRNFGKRASKRDPEDRILNIDDRGERVVVTTSENQMAVGLAKAVDAAFKGGKLRITWSDDDLPARAHWTRKGTLKKRA